MPALENQFALRAEKPCADFFPGKQAVVLTLYDELSAEYAAQAGAMKAGKWRDRFVFALRSSEP